MSRIGKKPITVPEKVSVELSKEQVKVKGPNGNLEIKLSPSLEIVLQEKKLTVKPRSGVKEQEVASLWGLTRTLVSNMVDGVTVGFKKTLEFNGVGYRASVSGSTLTLNLGYSHSIDFPLPKGVTAKVDKNSIVIQGADKELVGFVSAKIRALREPEPYKGKGVKYLEETIVRKAGKSGGKK